VVRTNTRFLVVAFLLLAVPGSSDGQGRADPPARVTWPLIDFLVLGDSTHGVQLFASPNLSSAQGRTQSQAVTIILQPVPTRLWASGVAAVVESIARLPLPNRAPFVTLALTGNRGRAWLRISLGATATAEAPFDFEIFDSARASPATDPLSWSVPASAPEVLGLLTALDAVAEHSAFDSTAAAFDTTRTYLAEQLDSLPRPTGDPHIQYPTAARARRGEGRVWVEFVIDTSGAIQGETVRVLLSDGAEFSQAALDALATLHYTPGMRRGARVKTLVRSPFIFRMAPDSLRRVRVPFTVETP
jgi:TonB family protein